MKQFEFGEVKIDEDTFAPIKQLIINLPLETIHECKSFYKLDIVEEFINCICEDLRIFLREEWK